MLTTSDNWVTDLSGRPEVGRIGRTSSTPGAVGGEGSPTPPSPGERRVPGEPLRITTRASRHRLAAGVLPCFRDAPPTSLR
jgi:hypothetical protein